MSHDTTGPDAPAKRGGRPTREEAARRDQRLLDVATRLFMERGFDGTSIDAVAEEAGVGKPTLYARYRDKRELFEAVLAARIDEWIAPVARAAEQAAVASGDLEAVLDEVSRAILRNASHPGAVALRRVVAAQSLRFPELARLAYDEGWGRALEAVASILRSFVARGVLDLADPALAAELFLSLLLSPSSRAALYGVEIDAEQIEHRRLAAVALFLHGILRPA